MRLRHAVAAPDRADTSGQLSSPDRPRCQESTKKSRRGFRRLQCNKLSGSRQC